MDSESLKEMVRTELSRQDFQTRLQNIVKEMDHLRSDYEPEHDYDENKDIDEGKALRLLRDKGLVEDIISGLKIHGLPDGDGSSDRPHPRSAHRGPSAPLVRPGEGCFLLVEAARGRAFIEHLVDHDAAAQLQLSLAFRTQRFRSKWTPCCAEPDFAESFLVRLSEEEPRAVSLSDLLATRDPLHLVLVKRDTDTGETALVSSHLLEWRIALCSDGGRAALTVELSGTGPEARTTVGLLELRVELLPRPSELLEEGIVSSQISLERGRQAERERIFLVYAKQWWREFLQIRENHASRLVKIFAQDENGVNRLVCCYVRPLRASRLLESPRQAARFVACLPFERTRGLGAGTAEQWATAHAVLARNRGDVEDHAVLLCSLLLGFGLDAYVAIGTKARASGAPSVYAWVVTIGSAERDAETDVVFWDAISGARYPHRPSSAAPSAPLGRAAGHGLLSVGCLFNHRRFLANCHPSDRLDACHFLLGDPARWKAMSEDTVAAATDCGPGPALPCLAPPSLDPVALSNDLEAELRALVAERRKDDGLMCVWDDQLSFLLSQALRAYETERETGLAVGNEEFQMAIRRHVPDGHTFKGYPLQVQHLNAQRALKAALKSPICQQIVTCRGDFVRLAVRARVYCHAESACATWLMLACTYKSAL